jgi:hypothetical protein
MHPAHVASRGTLAQHTTASRATQVEKVPKPVASCAMPAGPGMKVKTDTPLVKKAREGVMEFLLVSWPGLGRACVARLAAQAAVSASPGAAQRVNAVALRRAHTEHTHRAHTTHSTQQRAQAPD